MPAQLLTGMDLPAAVADSACGRVDRASLIVRGVMRFFADLGYASLAEFPLRVRRRADIVALNQAGEILIVEVKSSRADFRADQKWPEYRDFCDRFYFAVAPDFPREILPGACGLIVADRHGAAILHEAPVLPLNANRRRAQTLQIALCASQRLTRLTMSAPTMEAGGRGTG